MKGSLGKAKPFTHKLPPINHVYGKLNKADPFNAASLLSSWDNHSRSVVEIKTQDFKAVNRMALKQKITKVKALNKFRENLDVRLK